MSPRSPHRRHDEPILYKYTSAAAAKEVLRTGRLRWSSPLRFNDPFDVPRQLDLPFTVDELREATVSRIEEYIAGTAQPAAGTPFEAIRDLVSGDQGRSALMLGIVRGTSHMLAMPYDAAMEDFRSAWAEKVNHLRILCLACVGDSPAMWAHYADEHKGVVLLFESSDERDSSTLLATPVIYRSEPPALPLVDRWVRVFLSEEEVDWSEYFHECYYVKSLEWSYEKEYRAISASQDEEPLYSDMEFLREDLVGIVLGAAIDQADEDELRELAAGYPSAVVYRARHDQATRSVTWERDAQ